MKRIITTNDVLVGDATIPKSTVFDYEIKTEKVYFVKSNGNLVSIPINNAKLLDKEEEPRNDKEIPTFKDDKVPSRAMDGSPLTIIINGPVHVHGELNDKLLKMLNKIINAQLKKRL